MARIRKVTVATGTYWVGIPEVDLYILCGCPADSVKHMIKQGFIRTTEKDGVSYEFGPNAILLSDVSIQNGEFANLAEFPVLQMLYFQGMIIPGHPNNKGVNPLLIGKKEQVEAQREYIYRGNYGLTSVEELMEAEATEELAHELMEMKLKFAFGKIRKTEELLDSCIIEDEAAEVRGGVSIKRLGLNLYEIRYKGEALTVDLNLTGDETYAAPYKLGFYPLHREQFSVIHSGDGNGWDLNRPCMASIISFQGKIYLIDAGPDIAYSLQALGVDISEIEGVFHTHAHDDHFSGMPVLMLSNRRIKYYATPLVRVSVFKKLAALLSIEGLDFEAFFEVHDLQENEWNNVSGLEVKPLLSPHPVETNFFVFRSYGKDGYRTYAHLADITSDHVLKGMLAKDKDGPGISKEFYEQIRTNYLTSADLKKIDVGGGMIHGEAQDFESDKSRRIVLSHTSKKLTRAEKSIGSETAFGTVDVLIPGHQDFLYSIALSSLKAYFPEVPESELHSLANGEILSLNIGTLLLRRGGDPDDVYLTLSGSVEVISPHFQHILSTRSLIGNIAALDGEPYKETFRAASFVQVLHIPSSLFRLFLERNELSEQFKEAHRKQSFLQETWLLGSHVSFLTLNCIAREMQAYDFKASEIIPLDHAPGLFIFEKGDVVIRSKEHDISFMDFGDFCHEETVLFDASAHFEVCAESPSRLHYVPKAALEHIPVIHWKLLEIHNRRVASFRAINS